MTPEHPTPARQNAIDARNDDAHSRHWRRMERKATGKGRRMDQRRLWLDVEDNIKLCYGQLEVRHQLKELLAIEGLDELLNTKIDDSATLAPGAGQVMIQQVASALKSMTVQFTDLCKEYDVVRSRYPKVQKRARGMSEVIDALTIESKFSEWSDKLLGSVLQPLAMVLGHIHDAQAARDQAGEEATEILTEEEGSQ